MKPLDTKVTQLVGGHVGVRARFSRLSRHARRYLKNTAVVQVHPLRRSLAILLCCAPSRSSGS